MPRRLRPALLAVLLGLALPAAGCGPDGGAPSADPPPAAAAPDTWDLGALPQADVLRAFDTPGGVRVLVLEEGQGEPLARGEAMDAQLVGYVRNGVIVERDTRLGFLPEPGRGLPGLVEGLRGMRVLERRRVLIPSALAYGAQGRGAIPPHADLIYDARRVHLVTEDLQVGTGEPVTRGMELTVHYRGTREDGSEFDSSYRRGEPFTFRLPADPRAPAGVIEGWVRGVRGMRVGGVRRLWIPYHLAYGERGQAPKIAPYTNLVFVIEILDARAR